MPTQVNQRDPVLAVREVLFGDSADPRLGTANSRFYESNVLVLTMTMAYVLAYCVQVLLKREGLDWRALRDEALAELAAYKPGNVEVDH